VITPRTTRLLRAPDLRALQRAILAAVHSGWEARATAIVLPTTSAAGQFRRTMEDDLLREGNAAVILPDLITRGGFYSRLHERLPGAPPRLADIEREVLLRLSAEEASRQGVDAPFRLRPGLLSAILEFYDELRRRSHTIDSFDRHLSERLEPGADSDRGAARLLRQTRFLSATFAAFERRVGDSGRVDEHAIRALALSTAPAPAYRHIIVAVADQAADPLGLWPADFDLLSRMPGLERLDIASTDRVLASGWHQRLHDVLPGFEEGPTQGPGRAPLLLVPPPPSPPAAPSTAVHFTARDREEELADAARWVKARARAAEPGNPIVLDRTAVVFSRPLPYLYVARQVFASASVPYQAVDALPLAAEPFAAAMDLLFTVAAEEGTRPALIDLLASPFWSFRDPESADRPIGRPAVAALDRVLSKANYLGGWERLNELARGIGSASPREAAGWRRAAPALRAAAAAGEALGPVREAPTASAQISALLEIVAKFERLPRRDEGDRARHLRARTAVLGALAALRDAHLRYDDRQVAPGDLFETLRRWIEGQTFAPRTGARGVLLLDARAAAFASVDAVRLVGLSEPDWPERTSPGIFYPATLLRELGWPPDSERLPAARARFHDLLRLADEQVVLSTFTLEDDALVSPSVFLEDVPGAGLEREVARDEPFVRIFTHEALTIEPIVPDAITGAAAAWLTLRAGRTPALDSRYRGTTTPREAETYAVSRVERYLECPFKYFAGHVLQLEEEREEESGLTPQERGKLLHAVFEAFFVEWRDRGRTTITATTLSEAVALFAEVAEAQLLTVPEADRGLERTYLLGSAVAPGLAERAFGFELEGRESVVERLLEYPIEGAFRFEGGDGARTIRMRGKSDRIDLLEGGGLRVVDYKTGRAPKPARALQLAVYAAGASQQLEMERGGKWPVVRAGYVAFKEKQAFVDLAGRGRDLEGALREGAARFIEAIDSIEAGQFPVDPEEPYMCTRCGFSHVCRKDYVGDE